MYLAMALITFISYMFLFQFLPEAHKLDNIDSTEMERAFAYLVRGMFLYFSVMTYVFLFKTWMLNPGYLPKWLTDETVQNRPELLRIYNMRTWMANNIYDFD